MSQIEHAKVVNQSSPVVITGPAVDLSIAAAPEEFRRPLNTQHSVSLEGYEKLVGKLFTERIDGKQRAIYSHECDEAAAQLNIAPADLVARAFDELRAAWPKVELDVRGRVLDVDKVGKHFEALYKIIDEKLDFWIISNQPQLECLRSELSPRLCASIGKVIDTNEAVMITIAKVPPKEIANEIQDVSENQLHGIMSLWTHDQLRASLTLSPELRNYLDSGTVKIRTTSDDAVVKAAVKELNQSLEETNSFEDIHWLRVVKGIAHNEKQESLKDALKVCIPIVVCIKAAETFAPHLMHIAGGVLDDIFGAILPDVSQSMGQKEKPFAERFKKALPVLLGGAASIPFSFGFAWLSSHLYQEAAPLSVRMAAGAAFALACCAGTLGTSIAAFNRSWKAIQKAQEDPLIVEATGKLSAPQKAWLAIREAILDVPFRVGHTAIGVPVQMGLGIAAGAFGFFNSGLFVMVEGMAETILGAAAAFVYPKYVEAKKQHHLHTL